MTLYRETFGAMVSKSKQAQECGYEGETCPERGKFPLLRCFSRLTSGSDTGGAVKVIGRLNHVALAVADLSAAMALYRETFGAVVSEAVEQPTHGVIAAVRRFTEYQDRTPPSPWA